MKTFFEMYNVLNEQMTKIDLFLEKQTSDIFELRTEYMHMINRYIFQEFTCLIVLIHMHETEVSYLEQIAVCLLVSNLMVYMCSYQYAVVGR